MNRLLFVPGLLAVTALTACTADPTEPAADSPVARFLASGRSTADLGVTTWEVRPDGTDDRVIGRDASSERQVELTIHRDAAAPEDRVDFEVVFPNSGTLRVTRAGVIESASSDDLRQLGLDVSSDLGPAAIPIADGTGSTESALSITDPRINDSGIVHMGWNLWTYSQTLTLGGRCASGTVRHHGEIFADFGAFAIWQGWAFTAPETDCTARFFMQVNGGHWDDFHWRTFNAPVDIAAGKAASQSTTLLNAFAARAVDGNIDGNWYDNSVTHTDYEYRPWWQVDLGTSRSIGGVVVFNRTDCCADRLSDFDVLVSDDGVTFTTAASMIGPATPRTEFAMAVTGRFVRVQLRGTNYLSLAEVQVYAP